MNPSGVIGAGAKSSSTREEIVQLNQDFLANLQNAIQKSPHDCFAPLAMDYLQFMYTVLNNQQNSNNTTTSLTKQEPDFLTVAKFFQEISESFTNVNGNSTSNTTSNKNTLLGSQSSTPTSTLTASTTMSLPPSFGQSQSNANSSMSIDKGFSFSSSSTTTPAPVSLAPISTFSFGLPTPSSSTSSSSPSTTKTLNGSTGTTLTFGSGPNTITTISSSNSSSVTGNGTGQQPMSSSSLFTFGSSSSTTTSSLPSTIPSSFSTQPLSSTFSFQGIKPPTSQPVANGTKNDSDEEEEPPKPEGFMEDDHVFTKRVKVYEMVGKAYKDKGVGNLFIKKLSTGKSQLLIRADNTLGTILLNVVLNAAIALKLNPPNNILTTVPPAAGADKSSTFIIRVKTLTEAEELLATLEKHKL